MARVINLSLSESSIDAAIRTVQNYQNSLPQKMELLRQRVAEELADDIRTGFNGNLYDDVIYRVMRVPDVNVTIREDGNLTVVIAHGKEAFFVEFGAGVYYNPGGGAYPNRPPDIDNIGEYGFGYGSRPVWGYYEGGKTSDPEENKRRLRLTHGTPASMPMYRAIQRIIPRVTQIAREIFRGGDG